MIDKLLEKNKVAVSTELDTIQSFQKSWTFFLETNPLLHCSYDTCSHGIKSCEI